MRAENEIELALSAIRARGGDVARVAESWSVEAAGRRQVFVVESRDSPLARGEPYDTWIVSFELDGSVLAVERFTSRACRA